MNFVIFLIICISKAKKNTANNDKGTCKIPLKKFSSSELKNFNNEATNKYNSKNVKKIQLEIIKNEHLKNLGMILSFLAIIYILYKYSPGLKQHTKRIIVS